MHVSTHVQSKTILGKFSAVVIRQGPEGNGIFTLTSMFIEFRELPVDFQHFIPFLLSLSEEQSCFDPDRR